MADIQKLKETLEQIQQTQKALVDKVNMLISEQVLKQSISKESLNEVSETVANIANEITQETPAEEVPEALHETFHEEQHETVTETSVETEHEEENKTSHKEVAKESSDESPDKQLSEQEPSGQSQAESSQESQTQPQETPKEFEDIDPMKRIEDIPEETRKKTSEVNKYDLGDGLHYYEEDGICYIDVDKDDEMIDQVRAKIVSASLIRDYIKNGEFEKIKPYVPEDAYEALYNEYCRWERAQGHLITEEEKNMIAEHEKEVERLSNELNDVLGQLAGKIPGWKRRQLIPRRDTLRKEINNHKGFIEKLKHGEH